MILDSSICVISAYYYCFDLHSANVFSFKISEYVCERRCCWRLKRLINPNFWCADKEDKSKPRRMSSKPQRTESSHHLSRSISGKNPKSGTKRSESIRAAADRAVFNTKTKPIYKKKSINIAAVLMKRSV